MTELFCPRRKDWRRATQNDCMAGHLKNSFFHWKHYKGTWLKKIQALAKGIQWKIHFIHSSLEIICTYSWPELSIIQLFCRAGLDSPLLKKSCEFLFLSFFFFSQNLILISCHFSFWFWVFWSFAFHSSVLRGFSPSKAGSVVGSRSVEASTTRTALGGYWHQPRPLLSLSLMPVVPGEGMPTSGWGRMKETCPPGGGAGFTWEGKFDGEAATSTPGRSGRRAGPPTLLQTVPLPSPLQVPDQRKEPNTSLEHL